MMLSFMLMVLMRSFCQKALIRAMNAVLSYHHFWLPGLMHNFLFEVLQDVWASCLKRFLQDDFDFFHWFHQFNYHAGSRRLQCNTLGENSPKGQCVQCNRRTAVRLFSGLSVWLSVLLHGCFIKVRNVRDVIAVKYFMFRRKEAHLKYSFSKTWKCQMLRKGCVCFQSK